jgi:hypothetical protein
MRDDEDSMIGLHDFTGTWRLARRIVEDDGQVARLTGTARFEPLGQGALMLREKGTLHLPGQGGFAATRCYAWWPGQGGVIEVRFDDGRPFHSFDPNTADSAATHWCAPDTYAVRYDFSRWPEWSARWRVDGPRKGYTMYSRYLMQATAGA